MPLEPEVHSPRAAPHERYAHLEDQEAIWHMGIFTETELLIEEDSTISSEDREKLLVLLIGCARLQNMADCSTRWDKRYPHR